MSGPTTHAAGSNTSTLLSPRPLTKSALDAHDLPEGSRLTISNISSRSMPTAPIILTPLDHLQNTSYFPVTLKSVVSSTVRPSLTSAQSQAHALGYNAVGVPVTPGRYYTFPSPPIRLSHVSRATSGASMLNGSSVPGSGSSGNPISQESTTPQLSMKASAPPSSFPSTTLPTSSPTSRLGSKRKTHPHFTWTPGSPSQPIFDPDYPDGTPACISPRVRSVPATSENHSKDYFGTSRSSTTIRALKEAIDAAYPPPRSESPPQSVSTTQVGAVEAVQPGEPRSPSASTIHDLSSDKSAVVDRILREISEMSATHGSLGAVDDVFGHITTVRPDGTHPNGAIPWAEMPKYIAKAKKDALEKEKELLDLDKRLKGRTGGRREEKVKVQTGNVETEWIRLNPLWTCTVVGVKDSPQEGEEELGDPGSERRTESGETFTTALSHQELEREPHSRIPEKRTPSEGFLQADVGSDGDGDEVDVDTDKLTISGQVK